MSAASSGRSRSPLNNIFRSPRRSRARKNVQPTGDVFVWGRNDQYQLGLGSNGENQFTPVQLEELSDKRIEKVYAGRDFCAALTANGEALTWGEGSHGALGHSETTTSFFPRVVASLRGRYITSMGCGYGYSMFVTKNGSVYVCGTNKAERLGIPGATQITVPTAIPNLKRGNVIQAELGLNHAMVLTTKGEVISWGSGVQGRNGSTEEESYSEPTLVLSVVGKRPKTIVCGTDHSGVLSADGDLFVFGEGSNGRLGLGPEHIFPYSAIPRPIIPIAGKVRMVSAGIDHMAICTRLGELWTWGYGANGRLGHGDELDCWEPRQVESLRRVYTKSVACGSYHTATISDSGNLYMFGWNQCGQCGVGDTIESILEPRRITFFGEREVLAVSCGEQHTIALLNNATNA